MSNTIEPTVIDEDLLVDSVRTQYEQEMGSRQEDIPEEIMKRETIEPGEVVSLRLDYKNILKIDNLWSFENLTRLQLDNNIIEKIENINFLRNLEWLDLSFNNISVIEGLNGLVKLTDLSLYNNRITRIENMDELLNLQVLSVGNNGITHLENVTYLSRLPNLRVANFAGNPVAKEPEFKNYAIANIKNLKYLDYRLIEPEHIKFAREKYVDVLIAIEQSEKEAQARQEQEALKKESDELLQSWHLDHIDMLFETIFKDDKDLAKYRHLADQMLKELHDDFKVKLDIVITELRHFVLKQVEIRADEIKLYQKCTDDVKGEVDKECISRIRAFIKYKKHNVRRLQNAESAEIEQGVADLRDRVRELSNYLMSQELVLVEQFEDVVKEVEQNYTSLCSSALETARQRMRELENECHEKVSETIMLAFERFAKTDMDELDDTIRELLADKDALVNMLNNSHDYHLGKIDQQEETLVSGINRELEQTVTQLQKNEILRNRDRVIEIKAFKERCLQEIEALEETI